MEILIYLTDVLLTGWLLFWCGRNTERAAGAPVIGLFRYREAQPTTPNDARARSDISTQGRS